MLNEDYREMLQTLLENEVRFLVVGAYALAAYGYHRATQVSEETFAEQGIIFQIGVAPHRIDILTHIDGVDFQEAYQAREKIALEGMHLPFLSQKNLIKNKKSTGREKDILDARTLEEGK